MLHRGTPTTALRYVIQETVAKNGTGQRPANTPATAVRGVSLRGSAAG